ncbi:hypothetical protein AAVH_30987 [Aphelenchoides avenae]|nr:hypothetical protein AAVH_30987 [Aphelenchus avenae]
MLASSLSIRRALVSADANGGSAATTATTASHIPLPISADPHRTQQRRWNSADLLARGATLICISGFVVLYVCAKAGQHGARTLNAFFIGLLIVNVLFFILGISMCRTGCETRRQNAREQWFQRWLLPHLVQESLVTQRMEQHQRPPPPNEPPPPVPGWDGDLPPPPYESLPEATESFPVPPPYPPAYAECVTEASREPIPGGMRDSEEPKPETVIRIEDV